MHASTNNPLSKRFGSITVISLANRQDRRDETKKELLRIRQNLHEINFYLAVKPQERGPFPSPGVRGAFESHLQVLCQAADDEHGAALVLEDDVEFVRDFEEQQALIDQLPSDWDMFYLGHSSENPKPVSEPKSRLRECHPDEELIGLHCYAISQKALPPILRQLRQFPANEDPERGIIPMPVDGALNAIRRLSPSIKCYLADPPLANQRSSRTDVADLKWFDKLSVLERPVSILRRVKNKLRQ